MMDGASHNVMRDYEVRLGAPEGLEEPPAAVFRSDTAFAFNVSLGNVRITRVQQLSHKVSLQLSARSDGECVTWAHVMSRVPMPCYMGAHAAASYSGAVSLGFKVPRCSYRGHLEPSAARVGLAAPI